MATTDMKSFVSIDDTARPPGRVRTAKEAAELLEALRRAYRSRAPEERREIKGFMAELSESQGRFGVACIATERSWSERRING